MRAKLKDIGNKNIWGKLIKQNIDSSKRLI